MTSLTLWEPSQSAEKMARALKRDGAIILNNMCDGKRLSADLDPWFEDAAPSQGTFYGSRTNRIGALIGKSPLCRELAVHPLILELVNNILGPQCDRVQLNLTQGIDISPGQTPQFLHRDDDLFPFAHEFDCMVNVMWAVSPFTPENGATRFIPGSHTWPRDRAPDPDLIETANINPGSCLVYVGSLFHGGGANNSETQRRGAVISYNLGWLRQTENFYLSVPWGTAQHFDEPLLRLMGYQLQRPNVGWVEGIDPLRWIKLGRPAICSAEDALTPSQIEDTKLIAQNPDLFAPYLT